MRVQDVGVGMQSSVLTVLDLLVPHPLEVRSDKRRLWPRSDPGAIGSKHLGVSGGEGGAAAQSRQTARGGGDVHKVLRQGLLLV